MASELDFFTDSVAMQLDEAKSFTSPSSRYEVKNLSYPEGIGIQPDLQHYISFYINVRGKSKFVKQGKNDDQFINLTNPAAGQNRIDNRDLGKALPLAVGAAGVLAAATASVFGGGSVRERGARLARGVAAAGTVAAGTVAAQQLDLLKPDETKRLKDVITLHVEERPSVRYSANYENKELGALVGAMAGGGSATDSTNTGGGAGEYAAFAAMQAAKIPNVVGLNQASLLTQLSAKVTTNPFREVFFESIDFRTFNFRYKFFPKNKSESDRVQNIINTFKFHMHPELSASGLFYIYPSEFEIRYFYRDRENKHFNKISTCVLTDMQVEYGGEQFSSFRDGSPVEYTMTLTFRELEILTKDQIERGF